MAAAFEQKASMLRREMSKRNLDAYLVLSFDPHRSIAVADHWKTVQWMTGFTGWVCTMAVTAEKAAFWTDDRYVKQAARELPQEGIEKYCISAPTDPKYPDWLLEQIPQGGSLGVFGGVMSLSDYEQLEKLLSRKGISIFYQEDLVDAIWQDRPGIPAEPLFELELRYSGRSRTEKLADVREHMKEKKADYYLASGLDDVAWLTNLRGGDSPLYPIFHGYVLVGPDEAALFTIPEKLPPALTDALKTDGIAVVPMEGIAAAIEALPIGSVFCFDPHKTAMRLVRSLPQGVYAAEAPDIITGIKCCKNQVEQENVKRANVYEAVCVARLIKHVKDNIGKVSMDEYSVGQWVNGERAKVAEFLKPANVPIVGCKDHAVQLHYRPAREHSAVLPACGFLLFDLCAHYLLGSTDITRTVALGEVTEEMRRDYTIVLKSQIRLATQKFLYGCTGPALDAVVKSGHWNLGLTFGAGVGHGMGYCLYIQEGPCKMALDPSPYFSHMFRAPIRPGMLFSNEPGIYKAGKYAIRLENTILVKDAFVNEQGRFLTFDTITFIPYEMDAVDPNMLTPEEREWLNSYNRTTYELLSPHMTSEEAEWLKEQTRQI